MPISLSCTAIRRRITSEHPTIERKKCKNTQNISLKGWLYLLFEEYVQGKTCVLYILKLGREIGQSFIRKENLREDKLVKNIEIFWMNAKTIIEFGFRMKNYADLGGCYLPQTSDHDTPYTLLDLQNSLYHTQPHLIIMENYLWLACKFNIY